MNPYFNAKNARKSRILGPKPAEPEPKPEVPPVLHVERFPAALAACRLSSQAKLAPAAAKVLSWALGRGA